MSQGKLALLIILVIGLIAVTGLVLAATKPEFDPGSGCYFNPSEGMINDYAHYTCYITVQGKRVCCLNEYLGVL